MPAKGMTVDGKRKDDKTAENEIDQEGQEYCQEQLAAEIRLHQRAETTGRRERINGRLGDRRLNGWIEKGIAGGQRGDAEVQRIERE